MVSSQLVMLGRGVVESVEIIQLEEGLMWISVGFGAGWKNSNKQRQTRPTKTVKDAPTGLLYFLFMTNT